MVPGAAAAAFAGYLRAFPPVPWGVEATSHWACFLGYVHVLMAWCFPFDQRKPKKPWIKPETWALMEDRVAMRQLVKNFVRSLVGAKLA